MDTDVGTIRTIQKHSKGIEGNKNHKQKDDLARIRVICTQSPTMQCDKKTSYQDKVLIPM